MRASEHTSAWALVSCDSRVLVLLVAPFLVVRSDFKTRTLSVVAKVHVLETQSDGVLSSGNALVLLEKSLV